MKERLWIVVISLHFIVLQFSSADNNFQGRQFSLSSPWPYPAEMKTQNDMMSLDPKAFTLGSNAASCDILTAALDRYKNLIFQIGAQGSSDPSIRKLYSLSVKIDKDKCGYPSLEDDESYTLEVNYDDQTAHLSANYVWGALRGLETFSQLVYIDPSTKTYRINTTIIKDQPRFQYRGIMIDTSRHFIPINILKMNLDAMAYNKLNVFHWHLVDDQSFPFESLIYPNLTTLGAYDRLLVYSQSEVKELIAYARLRGIRVVPEFDTPAHTTAMGIAFPHLMTRCEGESRKTLNPTLQNTYDVLKEIFKELQKVFPDKYIHLGMNDLNNTECWDKNPDFYDYRKKLKLKDTEKLASSYVSNVINIADDLNLNTMVWEDAIEINDKTQIPKDAIVQLWRDRALSTSNSPWYETSNALIAKKVRLVVSSCFSMDYISYGEDWTKFYQCDPQYASFPDKAKEMEKVIGGEALMWSEYVDATNLMSRLWPRASAMAERLWSTTMKNKVDEARPRLEQMRCLMLRRGIPAEPLKSGYCGPVDRNLTVFLNNFQSPDFKLCTGPVNNSDSEDGNKDCKNNNSGQSLYPTILIVLFLSVVLLKAN